MSWFSKIGTGLSDVFKGDVAKGLGDIVGGIDNVAVKADPLTHFNSWLTSSTLGKIPGIGPEIDNLQGKVSQHPLESFAALASAYFGGGALLGAGAGAGAGAAGAAADATAMGGAAGTLGAADSAAASAELGLTAADVGGATAIGDTAMGGAAGTLGAVDSAAASTDLGLTAADVAGGTGELSSAAVGPGGFADLSLGGGSIGSDAGQMAGNFISSGGDLGAAAPDTASGFGGVGVDPSVMSSPDGGLALAQQAVGSATTSSAMGDALKTALKYGPAGVSLLRSVMGQGAASKAATAYGNVGSTQRATANGLVQGYNKGTLNPAESAGIDTWAKQQVAALRQFYANAGTADSTQAKQAEAAVMAKAVEMKNQASQNLLQVGLTELNSLDANTRLGIETNLQGDQAAQKAQTDFAAQFAKLIGSQQSGVAASPAPAPAGP